MCHRSCPTGCFRSRVTYRPEPLWPSYCGQPASMPSRALSPVRFLHRVLEGNIPRKDERRVATSLRFSEGIGGSGSHREAREYFRLSD